MLTEEEEARIGRLLIEVFRLKPIKDGDQKGRYLLGAGYHTKTAIGIYRTVEDIIRTGGHG